MKRTRESHTRKGSPDQLSFGPGTAGGAVGHAAPNQRPAVAPGVPDGGEPGRFPAALPTRRCSGAASRVRGTSPAAMDAPRRTLATVPVVRPAVPVIQSPLPENASRPQAAGPHVNHAATSSSSNPMPANLASRTTRLTFHRDARQAGVSSYRARPAGGGRLPAAVAQVGARGACRARLTGATQVNPGPLSLEPEDRAGPARQHRTLHARRRN